MRKNHASKICCLLGSLCFLLTFVHAQNSNPSTDTKEADYNRVISERAYKIVAAIGLKDSSSFYKVQTIVADQYKALGKIHDAANAQIKSAKAGTDKDAVKELTAKIEADRTTALNSLHEKYIASLSASLNADQVTTIKDGMTYNILNITYKAYGEMIPTLTDEQKKQIYVYLTEAREHAIDAESSNKKHEWFGKYKGKINNYLSAAGYDVKKEGEEWQKRIAAQKNKSTTNQ